VNDSPTFVPALGLSGLTGDYDRVIAVMTRERRWRSALLESIAPEAGDVIVDVGAGTGSQLIAIKQAVPTARVIGVDPDPAALALARQKAQTAGVESEWVRGFGDQVDVLVGTIANKIVSSLVLHQCDLPVKSAILRAMARTLCPGGLVAIADYGLQRTLLMRTLFRQVQALDGWERTGLNAKGILPELIADAGFENVAEVRVVQTPTGSISLYTGRKPF
jgi:ubiquinone/menaquinone biosynthesis C-methylase UbiE|tara:strand:+ start:8366 stop:9025 length:660 start_codon:yes stop_codon:yes gene_type:complete